MKSIISTLAAVALATGLLLQLTGCDRAADQPVAENPAIAAPARAGMLRGKVLETMDSGGYTYVLMETGQEPIWIAGPLTAVTAGDVVEIAPGMQMNEFTSQTLNRTFDVLFFVNAISNLTTPAVAQVSMPKPAATAVTDVAVAALEPGKDIAWVYANTDTLANQQVSLRGTVVKYNSNILGSNFLHIQDGSGDAADRNNDLTVTSEDTTALGETVVVTGTIVLDKDFGAGYSFPVLLENASITKD